MGLRHCAGATITALVCCVLVGCSSSTEPAAITATFNSSSDRVFEGAGSAGRSLRQQATDAIAELLDDYYETMSSLMTSDAGDIDELKEVTMNPDPTRLMEGLSGSALSGDSMLDVSTAAVKRAREAEWSGDGKETVTNMAVTNMSTPADSAGVPTEGMAFAEVRVCVDVSGFTPRLPDDRPAYNPNRRPQHLQKFLVLNPNWPDEGGWRLATQYVLNSSPCAAA